MRNLFQLHVPGAQRDEAGAQAQHPKTDPLFEHLVEFIVKECLTFVRRTGGEWKEYYITVLPKNDSEDVRRRFRRAAFPFLSRDGVDKAIAETVIERMIMRGCRGSADATDHDRIDLLLYRRPNLHDVDMVDFDL